MQRRKERFPFLIPAGRGSEKSADFECFILFCEINKKLKRDLKRSLSIKIVPYHGEIIASEIKGEKKQISIQMQREK